MPIEGLLRNVLRGHEVPRLLPQNTRKKQQERTDWHNCVAFGSTAEKYIGPYVKKGTLISIEGTLQTRSWEDKDGNKRYTTEVVANPFGGVQILNSGDGGGNYDSSAGMDQTPKSSEENTSQVTEDDLPF